MNFRQAVDVFNGFEAVLWIGLAFWVLLKPRSTKDARRRKLIWFVSLLLFGLSDLVELQTGVFWRPWWLLAWKAGCIACFAALIYSSSRRRRLDNQPRF